MTPISPPTTVDQNTQDNLTLTCLRCNHAWMRRNLHKLPKTCPKCGSRYWQKPLNPYWAAKRKNQTNQKQEDLQNLIAAAQRIQQLQTGQLNPADLLILYSSPNQADLEPIKHLCNYWLPEQLDPKTSFESRQLFFNQIYQIGNTIASMDSFASHFLTEMITRQQLPHDKVFLIDIGSPFPFSSKKGVFKNICVFTKKGILQTCQSFDWPETKGDHHDTNS